LLTFYNHFLQEKDFFLQQKGNSFSKMLKNEFWNTFLCKEGLCFYEKGIDSSFEIAYNKKSFGPVSMRGPNDIKRFLRQEVFFRHSS